MNESINFLKNISEIYISFLTNNITYIILFVLMYFSISFFLLRPIINKKIINTIGNNFKLKHDPLTFLIPILIVFTSLFSYILNNIL